MRFPYLRPAALGLALVVTAALVGCQAPKKKKLAELGTPLFDGKTLAGWSGLPNHWMVEDQAITGYTTKDAPIKNNTFLVWDGGPVANFELRFKYRVFNGNSGVQYRSQVLDPEKFIVGGYQADIDAGTTYSGILYEERGRGILALRGQRTQVKGDNGQTKVQVIEQFAPGPDLQNYVRHEDWNDYLIVARDNHVMHLINGRLMSDVVDSQTDKAPTSGVLAFQIHVGPPMKVQFKDIYLKPLP
jgi:hypothetical protein